MSYRGDIRLGDTIDLKFTTVTTAGVPITLAGSPVVSAYVGNSLTQITTGVTLTVDFDGVVGLHNVRVVASGGNGFATATNVDLVITAGTVDGASVVGYVVGAFSIEGRSALMPTTPVRTLDVSTTGEAGLDWANIGSPSSAQTLSGTTIKTATDVEADTADIQTRLPAALVNGRLNAYVGDSYELGFIWIDTVNGVAGTTAYQHGTKHNPVSSLANAVTLAAALNIRHFHVANGSTITLASAYNDWFFKSEGFGVIALGGQVLGDVKIDGFLVSGTALTGMVQFENCAILAVTVPTLTTFEHCAMVGPVTLGDIGNYFINDCEAANIGGVACTIDFGAAVGDANVSLRKWTGTVSLANMGQLGTDSATVAGEGRLIIAASSQNSTVRIAGNLTLEDNGAAMTFIEGSNYRSADDTSAIVNVQTDVDNIQTRLPAALVGGRIDASVGAVAAGAITAGSIATDAIDADALSADAVAEIKAGLVTALTVDTYAESAGVPAATATLVAKIAWLATLARNKITQTATTQTLRDDTDAVTVAAATVSDDGVTFTRGEWT